MAHQANGVENTVIAKPAPSPSDVRVAVVAAAVSRSAA